MHTLPLDQKIRFELLEFFSGEWNRMFQNFEKMGQLCKAQQILKNVLPGVLFDSSISPFEFPEFSWNCFRFGNLQFSEFPAPSFFENFGFHFHEHPAGMLREKRSY